MSAGWINLMVLIAIPLIVTGVVFVRYKAATQRGGQKKAEMAKAPKAHYRKVNPKTGIMSG